MHEYSNIQWLFFFYIYSFFGWCFESMYVSFCQRKLINRGFMRGTFLPLYGSGAVMMLFVSMPVRDNLWLVYIAGCVGATVLEYVTGILMEAIFKVRYWDYSRKKIQYKGHICLSSTLAWGGLTILMTEVIHKPIESAIFQIPNEILSIVTIFLTFIIAIDFTLSFRAALDLRDVLIKMEKGKEEMYYMLRRLDVIIALLDDAKETKKRKMEYRWEEIIIGMEEHFDQLKARVSINVPDNWNNLKEEIQEIASRFREYKESHLPLQSVKDFYKRSLLLSNPTMYSPRFREMLEELKRAASEHKRKK